MLLKKVGIKNFKLIKNLEFEFPESNILFLVGKNNTNKSNIKRVIDVVCGESWYSKEKLEDHDYYSRNRKKPIQIDLYFDNVKCVKLSPNSSLWGIKYSNDRECRNKVAFGHPSVIKEFLATYLGAVRTFDKHLLSHDLTLIG